MYLQILLFLNPSVGRLQLSFSHQLSESFVFRLSSFELDLSQSALKDPNPRVFGIVYRALTKGDCCGRVNNKYQPSSLQAGL